jgi:hypothetical protein
MLKPRTAVVCCTTLAAGAFLLASCQMPLRSQTISHEFFDDLKLIKESWIGSIVSPHAPVERQFDCLKRVEDNGSMFGWLGPLMQRIGCSWVKWTEFPPPVLAEFAVKLQPGSSWPAVFHIQPLDAVEPLGALEPIEHWRDKYYRRLPPGVWIKGGDMW